MSVFIIDNGLDYSDHALYFVEANEEEAKLLEKLITATSAHHETKILGSSPSVEWRKGGGHMSFLEFLESSRFYFHKWLSMHKVKGIEVSLSVRHLPANYSKVSEESCALCSKLWVQYDGKKGTTTVYGDCSHSVSEVLDYLKSLP